MAEEVFSIVRGSSRPIFEWTITQANGLPEDLTGADSATLQVGEFLEMATADLAIDATMTLGSVLTNGEVSIEFTSAQTDIPPGLYYSHIEVIFDGTHTAKYPGPRFRVLAAPEA